MKTMEKLITEKTGGKTIFKPEKEGVCSFCGTQTQVSKVSSRGVVKREKNPGITLSVGDYPYICKSCSVVYENLTRPSPKAVFSEGRFLVIDKEGNYWFIKSIEDLEKLKELEEGEYLIFYLLKAGKKLPTNFYDAMRTPNPKKNLIINLIEGIKVNPVIYETDDLIQKVKDKDYKSEFLINSIREEFERQRGK